MISQHRKGLGIDPLRGNHQEEMQASRTQIGRTALTVQDQIPEAHKKIALRSFLRSRIYEGHRRPPLESEPQAEDAGQLGCGATGAR